MKFINDYEYTNDLILKEIAKYPNSVEIAWYETWKALRFWLYPIPLIFLFFITIHVADYFVDNYLLEFAYDFSGFDFSEKYQKRPLMVSVVIASILSLFFLLYTFVIAIIHELLHGLVYKFINSYIVYKLPARISFICIDWHSKWRVLCSISSPFLFFTLLALFIYLITNIVFLSLWVFAYNLLVALSDLVVFFITLSEVPQNAIMLGNYYRHQQ